MKYISKTQDSNATGTYHSWGNEYNILKLLNLMVSESVQSYIALTIIFN